MRSEPLPSDLSPPRETPAGRGGISCVPPSFIPTTCPCMANQAPCDQGYPLAQPSKASTPRRLVPQNASQETAFIEPWQIT